MGNVDYYNGHPNSKLIKYNLLESVELKNREVSILRKGKMMRGFNIFQTTGFDYLFDALGYNDMGLFHSICYLDNLSMPKRPIQDYFSKSEESTERRKEYFEEYKNNVFGIDFVIDIDAPELDHAYIDAEKVYNHFKNNHIPFAVEFSGSKGFHFRILWDDLRDDIAKKFARNKAKSLSVTSYTKSIPSFYNKLTQQLQKRLRLKYVDKHIQQYNRVFRIPYSIHQNNQYVCLPLSDHQFDSFTLEYCIPENVAIIFPLKSRGILYRHSETKPLMVLK